MNSKLNYSSGLTKAIIIFEFLLVGYLIYSLTKNVYNSYVVDSYIEKFKAENAQIELENRQKNEDYLYFTSQEYIDKIAKQNLGLINPGEEVIILAPDSLNPLGQTADLVSEEEIARSRNSSNFGQWLEFFFGE